MLIVCWTTWLMILPSAGPPGPRCSMRRIGCGRPSYTGCSATMTSRMDRRVTMDPSPWKLLTRVVLLNLPWDPLLSLLPLLVPCPIECSVDLPSCAWWSVPQSATGPRLPNPAERKNPNSSVSGVGAPGTPVRISSVLVDSRRNAPTAAPLVGTSPTSWTSRANPHRRGRGTQRRFEPSRIPGGWITPGCVR